MLSQGDTLPDRTAPDQDGTPVSLQDYTNGRVAVYFYPKDDTPGCTNEACSLRDGYDRLNDAGITVLSVSTDSVASHQKFVGKHDLPFTLLADADGELTAAFDVKSASGTAKRVTFLIEDGTIVEVLNDVDTEHHAEQVLTAFEA